MLLDEVLPKLRMLLYTSASIRLLDGVDDPLVGLVRHDQRQVVDVDLLPAAGAVQAGDHRADGLGEHLAALHLDEAGVAEGHRQRAAVLAPSRQLGPVDAGLRLVEMRSSPYSIVAEVASPNRIAVSKSSGSSSGESTSAVTSSTRPSGVLCR